MGASLKKYYSIFFFLLVLFFFPSIAKGAQFCYRVPITINNTQNSNTLTDYQIKVTFNLQNYASVLRSDCGNIRFTNSTSYESNNWGIEYPYWIENCNTSGDSIVWVKVDNIPAKATKTIYIYIGNTSITSVSNGTKVFEFFDDFEINRGWSLSGKWHYTTYGATSQVLRYGRPNLNSYDGVANSGNADSPVFVLPSGCRLFYRDRSATEYTSFTTSPTYDKEFIYISTNGGSTWTQISIYSGTWSWTSRSIDISAYSSTNAKIRLRFDTVDEEANDYYGWAIDNIIIRKYTPPEPTYLIGEEEVVTTKQSINETKKLLLYNESSYLLFLEFERATNITLASESNELNVTLKEPINFSIYLVNYSQEIKEYYKNREISFLLGSTEQFYGIINESIQEILNKSYDEMKSILGYNFFINLIVEDEDINYLKGEYATELRRLEERCIFYYDEDFNKSIAVVKIGIW